MCRNVVIHNRDGSETICNRQGELQQAMPRELWFLPGHGDPGIEYDGYDPGGCLCPVDVERTARENGYRFSRVAPDGVADPFDDHYYPSPARTRAPSL